MEWTAEAWISLLGVAATLGFGIVAYRQTIGARRERARIARENVLDTLQKRLVLENSLPDGQVLEELLLAKSVAAKVSRSALATAIEVYSLLKLRTWENDFLTQEKRESLASKIDERVQKLEATTVKPSAAAKPSRQSRLDALLLLWLSASGLGLVVSLVAAQTAGLLDRNGSAGQSLSFSFQLLLIMALTGLATVLLIRARERLQTPESEANPAQQGLALERKVRRALLQARVRATRPQSGSGPNYILDAPGPTVIEVKAWPGRHGRVPNVLVKQAILRLHKAKLESKANHALLVTEEPLEVSSDLESEMSKLGVRILPWTGLKDELARIAAHS